MASMANLMTTRSPLARLHSAIDALSRRNENYSSFYAPYIGRQRVDLHKLTAHWALQE
jgi:hypothetical protein